MVNAFRQGDICVPVCTSISIEGLDLDLVCISSWRHDVNDIIGPQPTHGRVGCFLSSHTVGHQPALPRANDSPAVHTHVTWLQASLQRVCEMLHLAAHRHPSSVRFSYNASEGVGSQTWFLITSQMDMAPLARSSHLEEWICPSVTTGHSLSLDWGGV
jgi:hypothetical protein